MSNIIKTQLKQMIIQNSPDTTGECTITGINITRNLVYINFICSKGMKYNNVPCKISYSSSIKTETPKIGEKYLVGFSKGQPMNPYLINKSAGIEDEIYLSNYMDPLTYDNSEILDFS